MSAPSTFTRRLLEAEERTWQRFAPDEYDRSVCEILKGLGAVDTPERVEALLAFAEVTLSRDAPRLIESRGCVSVALLTVDTDPAGAPARHRAHSLFLRAWQQLATEAARGPDYVTTVPDLPAGALVPYGADPQSIADPTLREKARALEAVHAEEVERWNAKQRAIDHLNHLGGLVRAFRHEAGDRDESLGQLARAMSATPGLPSALRKRLEDASR
jgi:hypothetical protein